MRQPLDLGRICRVIMRFTLCLQLETKLSLHPDCDYKKDAKGCLTGIIGRRLSSSVISLFWNSILR